jgi:hypothetical protein
MLKESRAFDEIEVAYWTHAGNKRGVELRQFLEESPFSFRGVQYRRFAYPMKSNSGKSTVGWSVTYQGDDGTCVSNSPSLNRRHDPERNWGLGRG